MRWLLVNGADVNLARRDGCTPILAAAAAGNMGMLRQLCMAGANLMQTERSGISALVRTALCSLNALFCSQQRDYFGGHCCSISQSNCTIVARAPNLERADDGSSH